MAPQLQLLDPKTTMDAVAMLGNSDDKLTQARWSEFAYEAFEVITDHALHVHGEWGSHPFSSYQNAAISFTLPAARLDELTDRLSMLTRTYGQDSIALLVGQTQFVKPV